MQLVDIGLNLAHHRYDKDRAQVVDRAQAAGVMQAVLTGTTVEGSAASLGLADGRWSWSTVGVHPHNADELDDVGLSRLRLMAADPLCVAVGECGLDFERDFSPRADQERALEAQLDLAVAVAKPVFLHQRGAWDRFAAILAPYMPSLAGAVVHCFTDGPDIARAALELGCHLGITGWICDDRRAAAVRTALPLIPTDRLMLESDAPYLTPRDLHRGPAGESPVAGIGFARLKSRNEPALLPWICRAAAHYGGHDLEALAAASTATARRFFALPEHP